MGPVAVVIIGGGGIFAAGGEVDPVILGSLNAFFNDDVIAYKGVIIVDTGVDDGHHDIFFLFKVGPGRL